MRPFFLLLVLFAITASISSADEALTSTLIAADDKRIAAMQNPVEATLATTFSDDLRYTHSNGIVDTKATFLDILVSGKTKYLGYDHIENDNECKAPCVICQQGCIATVMCGCGLPCYYNFG